jgi:hypothetical protein
VSRRRSVGDPRHDGSPACPHARTIAAQRQYGAANTLYDRLAEARIDELWNAADMAKKKADEGLRPRRVAGPFWWMTRRRSCVFLAVQRASGR